MFDAELKTEFEQQGFVCLRGFVQHSKMKELQRHLSEFIEKNAQALPRDVVFYDDREDVNTLKQIQRLFDFDQTFHRMMFSSEFEQLARHLLEEDVRGVNMQYFNKPPFSSQPTPPHQDGYYFMLEPNEAVTMWLAIDPADEENGCVRYIPGSHLKGLREHQATETLGFSQGIVGYSDQDIADEACLSLQPGDLLVHHALTIHRADKSDSTTRSRRALGLIYYSNKAIESPEKQLRQNRLLQQLKMQGKI